MKLKKRTKYNKVLRKTILTDVEYIKDYIRKNRDQEIISLPISMRNDGARSVSLLLQRKYGYNVTIYQYDYSTWLKIII